MTEVMPIVMCLTECKNMSGTTLNQLGRIVLAVLTMKGRVTMLGISRWTEKGGSYRTVQRFFAKELPWANMMWTLFRTKVFNTEDEYIIAGDETIVTKSGKGTHGLDKFYSSIYNRPVKGLSFWGLSLVSVKERKSYPVVIEQRIKSDEEKKGSQAKKEAKNSRKKIKGKHGRPKGSKDKDKTQIEWNPELRLLEKMMKRLFELIAGCFTVSYLVLDGHFGNNNAMQVVLQTAKLHLISKLRCDSELYFRYDGEQKQFGRKRKYGDKIDYQNISDKYLVSDTRNEHIQTLTYQAHMLHHLFAQVLNIVIIVQIDHLTGKRGHVVLFSSDLELSYEKLVDYYRLRFQIEFNFRDAKQFWGLEDFMSTEKQQVTNAVNLSFFMVTLSHVLLRKMQTEYPDMGLLDLKSFFLGRRYASETLKLLPESHTPFNPESIIRAVAALGWVHPCTIHA